MNVLTSPDLDQRVSLPDRFQIEAEIGRGGMAVVYRAHDCHLDRQVAIKLLSENLSSIVSEERFQREIKLMAKLVHPGIVALFDSGESDGRLYYVMPFVSGDTLRARLVRERRMSMEDVAAYGADVAEALAYAHGLGIVHRDVKPENIFTVGGRALLADFGIAHLVAHETGADDGLTTAGMVIGTTSYMSPEQASGESLIDGRSDLYSLGCVLYELLTGAPPFTAPSAIALLGKHLVEKPRTLGECGIDISPAMEALVMQALAKNPHDRPQTAGEVARSLRNAPHRAEPAKRADTVATPRAADSEADRLLEEGVRIWQRAILGGPTARHSLDEARVYFECVLAIEPNNARALCGMSNWYSVMGLRAFAPRGESLAKSRELLFAALAADNQCADVHSSLGVFALYIDDDFHAAARHLRRSLELDPFAAEALRLQSIVYKILGRLDDAVHSARLATERAPDTPSMWNALGDALLAAGRNAEAVEPLRRALGLIPGYAPALERLELAQFRIGQVDLAVEVRASRVRLADEGDRADMLVLEHESRGAVEARRLDLKRELDQLLAEADREDPFTEHRTSRTAADRIVMAYAELGEWQTAMDWVERAYVRRPGRLRRMLTDPPFDRHGLANDPRYARLMRVAGMEELV